ncbi:type II toxin-antitoxin system RatA family toxin [Notoacmeibacter ruber]|uniref:Type II toxin-antitoxin system RatA family toxin n=1 Tax=Notoacmeibacter ruber TaxID=2670375 RepID=A0A3L7JAW1_9HYPH|nr:type II toxin-antitoxin system RatA family toxin [Notoacmeibacter ruber]RLQ87877.1 type II toxin-antitoxin system RatA family toxin [Notoacmeibacter ruber]
MPSFKTTRVVDHSADEMFALVADVESYPQFLPMCEALRIRSSKERERKTLLLADMTVGYKAIRETFTSKVLLNPEEKTINVAYVDGPFRYLDNQWRFEERGEGRSAVHFHIDYEFRNRILGAVMGTMFDRAFRAFAEAFERRADKLYGLNRKADV